ncbi:MAG: apolipoprotein N-acyltransferase [Candidatus Omnitrophica bacterium]|nr:apolipoprotein N-acyltransferase [Candidatus Omnitrophota bacterium]
MVKKLSLTILSAFLLILSFPKFELSFFIWFALVPLFFVIDGVRLGAGPVTDGTCPQSVRSRGFGYAYLCGFVFFLGTLYWIGFVTTFGMLMLVAYLSLYFALFGLGCSFARKMSSFQKLIFLPSLWTVLEYTRAHLLSGFSWASLSLSQYQNTTLIQMADVTGMFGVSFLIVFTNVSIWLITIRDRPLKRGLSLIFVFFCVMAYGRFHPFNRLPPERVKVAVIQGNIAQEEKWDPMLWPHNIEQHFRLTREAALENPDVIIWPETSLPGYFEADDPHKIALQKLVDDIQIPVLVGSILFDEGRYYNAAVLVSPQAAGEQIYRKRHLVPFGEYVPFRKYFPYLADMIPIEDFNAGQTFDILTLPRKDHTILKLSVMICFEDAVLYMPERFVSNGANVLVNITNDAWFHDTKAPFLHLQSSVFRAVEHRRSIVRAANTGVSCFINPHGTITGCVQNEAGKKTYVSGYRVAEVALIDRKSFYSVFKDVFVYMCFVMVLWVYLYHFRNKNNK